LEHFAVTHNFSDFWSEKLNCFQCTCTCSPHDHHFLPALLLETTLMFPSFPRPSIGSKESKKLFATGPHAAIKQQHDTDCTIHKEPAMLQTPSFALTLWPARSCMTVNQPGAIRGECQDRMMKSLESVVGAHLKTSVFPLCMWPWCISPCLHLRVCPNACKKSLFCAQVHIKLTVLRPRKCQR